GLAPNRSGPLPVAPPGGTTSTTGGIRTMQIRRRVPFTVLMAAVAALSAGLVTGALSASGTEQGGHGMGRGNDLIRESLAPSVPTDPAFHGVVPGAAPWVLKDGSVRLSDRGALDLRVDGL